MSSNTQGQKGGLTFQQDVNPYNLIIVRVKVPLPRCKGKSITPTVATSHQSVERGEKAVTGSLIWNLVEHESMDSESKDVSELS